MKKIGILTYHRVCNFGSLLQTYALTSYLTKQNCDVEVIDYYPDRLRKMHLVFQISPKWKKPIWKLLTHWLPAIASRLLGYNMMEQFLRKYVKLTATTYRTSEDLKKQLPQEDIYLNGSDQIWNIDTAEGLIDETFFMGFLPENALKMAYSGSFGQDTFGNQTIRRMKSYLEKYQLISVREKSGLDILHKMGIETASWVMDPTFLLEPNEWLVIGSKIKLPENYLLVYNLNRNARITNLAKKIATEKSLKIVNFSHAFVFISGAKNVIYPTPNDFITMFANAAYIVTDSFHGTAFSLNFKKQFICVPAPRFNSRLESILGLANISERLLLEVDDFDIINKKIDYATITPIFNTERQRSKMFLKTMLEFS